MNIHKYTYVCIVDGEYIYFKWTGNQILPAKTAGHTFTSTHGVYICILGCLVCGDYFFSRGIDEVLL